MTKKYFYQICVDILKNVCYNYFNGGDDVIKERIKELRKAHKLSQTAFGEVLGVSRDVINNIENGRVEPSELIIKMIVNEFGINTQWLVNGEGDMIAALNRDEEIAQFVGRTLADKEDTFQKRLIAALSKLSVEEWEVLEKLANDLAAPKEKEQD
ncbi:MAG: helix-turn-helix transcriptional regulator [Ruminococcaceae bacterium]|nr:helix-turn-helix transcriptional regulator [Oscillospiraceae bacterium]